MENKKKYQKPTMEVVVLRNNRTLLVVGSPGNDKPIGGGY